MVGPVEAEPYPFPWLLLILASLLLPHFLFPFLLFNRIRRIGIWSLRRLADWRRRGTGAGTAQVDDVWWTQRHREPHDLSGASRVGVGAASTAGEQEVVWPPPNPPLWAVSSKPRRTRRCEPLAHRIRWPWRRHRSSRAPPTRHPSRHQDLRAECAVVWGLGLFASLCAGHFHAQERIRLCYLVLRAWKGKFLR